MDQREHNSKTDIIMKAVYICNIFPYVPYHKTSFRDKTAISLP